MPRAYRITIHVDGRQHTGDWVLLQGCRVNLRSAWGNDIVEAGDEKLEVVAARTFERIVRAYHKQRAEEDARQQRELQRLARPQRSRSRAARDDDRHP